MSQLLPEPIQFGKYTLFERVARGGMADVFKGRIQGPEGFERTFVVKRILPHLTGDAAFIKMFVEEAKLSARLNHPNIVHIFELGTVEGELFISMEYIRGHDLGETMRALWRTFGPPRPDVVAYIGREMCRALSYAHSLTDEDGKPLGMIHRDVSPSNVMLANEGSVKLLDFGIAKALGDVDINRSGSLKGKYAYMAPEQTEGDNIDHRIDIFSAGIVMHEVLTGRRLFKGQNDMQTIERVRKCDIRLPSQINQSCPPELDAVVFRALARDRNERFQSAAEMADALDDIVHATRFTPDRMASILRAVFGTEKDPATGLPVDRRLASGAGASSPAWPTGGASASSASSTSSTSSSTSSSSWRSPTIPPVALPSTSPEPGAPPAAVLDSKVIGTIRPKPLWKKGGFWAVAALAAAGGGLAIARGTRMQGQGTPPIATAAIPAAAPSAPPRRVKRQPVLIQTDPEGADIYVAGKLESLGTTPMWVTLELTEEGPARVMVRKAGFQDKAIAIESDKPPTVHMIPIGATEPGHAAGEGPSGKPAETGAATAEGTKPAAPRSPATRWRPPAAKNKGPGELVDPF